MPMAPWAKLKTPEVVYVTTSPDALSAYTQLNTTPTTVYVRKVVMGTAIYRLPRSTRRGRGRVRVLDEPVGRVGRDRVQPVDPPVATERGERAEGLGVGQIAELD